MSKTGDIPLQAAVFVRDTCLCLHVQRAARCLGRRFDRALEPLGLTNGQFSLLMALSRPEPTRIGSAAALLDMDRTTLTAALKPLQRRTLVKVTVDAADRRSRLMTLTPRGRRLLSAAIPVWRRAHARLERDLADHDADQLRRMLRALPGRRDSRRRGSALAVGSDGMLPSSRTAGVVRSG
jgi:DNA-binding MarR family transcriptional regulator